MTINAQKLLMTTTPHRGPNSTRTPMWIFSRSISTAKGPSSDLANTSKRLSRKNSTTSISKLTSSPLLTNISLERLIQSSLRMQSCSTIRACYWMRSKIGKMPAIVSRKKPTSARIKLLSGREKWSHLRSASKNWRKTSRLKTSLTRKFKTTAWTWRGTSNKLATN